ncbi:MAG TPA: hypothetical protein VL178_03610 [Pseudomonas sp.]|nr:hypothetical protein [Pseudomonas sp.]
MEKKVKQQTESMTFYLTELCVFLSQVLIIFLVAYFISDMMQSEERLSSFVSSKVNALTFREFWLTLFSATFVLGLLFIIREMAPSRFVEKIATEVINELPRTIYLFGSSMTALTAAVAVFLAVNPTENAIPAAGLFGTSLFFAFIFFVYGCGAKFLLIRKKRQRLELEEISAPSENA